MPRKSDRRQRRKDGNSTCSELTCNISFRHQFYGCRPCGMMCNGKDNYTAHVNGQKHRKNLIRGHVFFPCRFCRMNVRAASWEAHMSKHHHIGSARFAGMVPGEEIQADFSGYKFCATCRTHITEDLWEAHLVSLRHEKRKGFVDFKARLRREIETIENRVRLEDVLDFGVVDPLVSRSGVSYETKIQATSQSKISLVGMIVSSERNDVPSPFSISFLGRQNFITPTKSVTLKLEFKENQVGQYTDTVMLIFEDVHFKKRFSISRRVQAVVGSPELHLSDIDMVPPEIWSNIIFFATRPPSPCYPLTTTTHQSFDLSPADNLVGHLSTLPTRTCVVLVSREWNAIGSQYLYEFLQLSRSSKFPELLKVLERSSGKGQVAQYVRCAVLPYEPNPKISPVRILELLPNLEVLIRSHNPPYEWLVPISGRPTRSSQLGSISPILGNLRRVDCTEHRFAGVSIGGLNHLPSTLRSCTSLEYLSIAGDCCETLDAVNLPSLITLRVERFVSTRRFCYHWKMDNLRHVVLHLNLNYTRLLEFWRQFGANLNTVELATSPGDVPRLNDEISDVLQYCPKLVELSYHIEFSQAPTFRNGVHTSLLALRIHAGYPSSSLSRHRPQFDQIAAHFNAFSKRTVPCLDKVTLCGVWTDVIPVQGINNILQKFGTSFVGPKVEREVRI